MGYRVLATVVLVLHFAFLAYVVFGGFLAWRWRHAIWPHLAAAGWGALIVAFALTCPLTVVESWARERAGGSRLDQGFIDRYIEDVLYPGEYTNLMRVLGALVVGVSWLVVVLRWRRSSIRTPDTARKSEDSSERAATV